jgi:hypothetical protein
MSKDLFDQFREIGEELQQQPSERVWSDVNKRLDQQRRQRLLKTKKMIGVSWPVIALLIIILLGCTFLALLIIRG